MESAIKPVLKRETLGTGYLNNFRSITNLKFLSKLFERAVVGQLAYLLAEHTVFIQARPHSTESGILNIKADSGSDTGRRLCSTHETYSTYGVASPKFSPVSLYGQPSSRFYTFYFPIDPHVKISKCHEICKT